MKKKGFCFCLLLPVFFQEKKSKKNFLSLSLSLSVFLYFVFQLQLFNSFSVSRSLHVLLVRLGVHQVGTGGALVSQLDLHHPAGPEGVGVDFGRVVDERVVDLNDFARDGGVDVRGRLDGLDDAVGLSGGDLGADFGELDVDDVAELGLLEFLSFGVLMRERDLFDDVKKELVEAGRRRKLFPSFLSLLLS